MDKITDFQIRLLKICDHVRWSEEDQLDGFKYHLMRRAVGQQDVVIEEELKMAAEAMPHMVDFDSGPHGSPLRSPWMDTWNVTEEEYHAAGSVDSPLKVE